MSNLRQETRKFDLLSIISCVILYSLLFASVSPVFVYADDCEEIRQDLEEAKEELKEAKKKEQQAYDAYMYSVGTPWEIFALIYYEYRRRQLEKAKQKVRELSSQLFECIYG